MIRRRGRRRTRALGIRISPRFVAKELDTLSAPDFRRERLGIVDLESPDDSAFPAAAWASVQYPGSRVGETGVVFGVDATKNLGWGAIVAADRRGRVEVVETREGVTWLEARVIEAANRWAGTVAIDVGGPVGYLADRLGAIPVTRLTTRG
ncbi:hypothetical protein BH24ACT7_BH24ACT7_24180 [soil metagenome]